MAGSGALVNPLADNAELPALVINEGTLVFRMDSRSLWSKYAWGLLNYSISMNNDLPGTRQVEDRLRKAAVALGDYIIPYYGITAGTTLTVLLSDMFKVGLDLVDAVKDERSTDEYHDIWKKLSGHLAEFLNELNPVYWPKILIEEMFNNMTTFWYNAIVARYNEDWSASEAAIDNLNKLVVTGIANHVNKGYSSIADIFSRGIIAQYPSLFVG
jgi:hypothetical protein